MGFSNPSTPYNCSFHNSVVIRALDLVSTYLSLEGAHPCDNIAAIITAGELVKANGKSVLTAILLSYEIHCRLCDSTTLSSKGWDHDTYGAFSVVIGVGKVLGLTATQLVQAINMAGVGSPMLGETFLGKVSTWKSCTFADNANSGILAALMASENLTGPERIIEGDMGFSKLITGSFDDNQFFSNLGDYKIHNISLKLWPCLVFTQPAVEIAIELSKKIADIEEVEYINIFIYDFAIKVAANQPDHWSPTTSLGANHSLPYCVAVALYDGDITFNSFNDSHLHNKHLLNLVSKIKVHSDPDYNLAYPKEEPCRLTIKLKSGKVLTARTSFALGHYKNPLTNQMIEEKFFNLGAKIKSRKKLEDIANMVWHLESLSNIGDLTNLFNS